LVQHALAGDTAARRPPSTPVAAAATAPQAAGADGTE